MSFVIDKTVTDKPPKKTVVSQFTGNNSKLLSRRTACSLLFGRIMLEDRNGSGSCQFPNSFLYGSLFPLCPRNACLR